jgi:N-acetyl-beta-hexosaminidase
MAHRDALRPRLTEKSASSSVGADGGGFYTHDDYRAIVAYAGRHHMIVVPEIDIPATPTPSPRLPRAVRSRR